MNQMLLDFENQWIFSPIEFYYLFLSSFDGWNQGLAWGMKEQQWTRGVSFGSIYFQAESVEKMTVVGRAWKV